MQVTRWLHAFLFLALCMPTLASAEENATAKLNQLFDDEWDFRMREDPLSATYYGDHRFDDLLPEVSVDESERRLAANREFLKRLQAIDRDALSPADRVNYDIFERLMNDRIAEGEFKTYLMPITNRGGFHVDFPELPKQSRLDTVEDYENYIARLNAFARYTDQHIALLRTAIEENYVLPADVLSDFDEPMKANIVDDPTQSLLYEPFESLPDTIEEAAAERLRASAKEAIASSVVPGYQAFLEFMTDEYVPVARTQVGASALPNGREYYRHRVRRFTTLDLTPQQVHQTGLDEVKRIRAEMEKVIKDAEFDGDFDAFVEFLRTDEQFYTDTPEQLLKEVSRVLKKMDGQLPSLFKTLPRMPYGIREIPAYIAPKTTTAYYMPPSGDGTRAGFYYVNTYDLSSRPLFEIEALSLHEAVPGHHLQIALQQELEGLPDFRRFAGFTAFVEGWGLYAERLGMECGFYEDPYSDFGRLSYEMWRACRLVVDSGMHYLGWTRQQAIDFMAANTALTLHNIRAEVDRYIAWPGQALAYKTGELTIRRLRGEAEEALGDNFDVREFHDVVLQNGAIPLDMLEANVRAYIAKETAPTNAD